MYEFLIFVLSVNISKNNLIHPTHDLYDLVFTKYLKRKIQYIKISVASDYVKVVYITIVI